MSCFGIVPHIVESRVGGIGRVSGRVGPIILVVDIIKVDWRLFVVENFHGVSEPDDIDILKQNIDPQKTNQLDADNLHNGENRDGE